MSERIAEILEIISYVAKRYVAYMSYGDVSELRKEAVRHVARQRNILESTVSSKFRRELQPEILGTHAFDKALHGCLESGASKLRYALEIRASGSELVEISYLFNVVLKSELALERQVEEDLKSLKEEGEVTEGGSKKRLVSYYERDPSVRVKAIEIHGTICKGCGFDFENVYGERGKNYIEAHHIVPVSTIQANSVVDPKRDLTVLCANCHRMVHRLRDKPLSVKDLVDIIAKNKILF